MRSRRAFTLLELLIIIAIMGLMVTVGVVSVRSGQGAARVRGATRDVFAAIRSARSIALVTQQPAIVTYSVSEEDGEPVPKIDIVSKKLIYDGVDRSKVRTLTGEPLKDAPGRVQDVEEASPEKGAAEGSSGGESLADILFAPVSADVVKGMRIKVLKGDEALAAADASARKSRVSVFSNVDYLLGKLKGENASDKSEKEKPETSEKSSAADDRQEPVKVEWEANGRVEPHQVWVYADGTKPEDGLLIKIDRFGAAKVVSGDGREE